MPKPPAWPKERDERLRVLASEGLTARQIGEQLGVTRMAVIGRAHRIGAQLRGTGRGQNNNRARASQAAKGMSVRQWRPHNLSRHINERFHLMQVREQGLEDVAARHAADSLRTDLTQFGDLQPSQCRYPVGERAPYLFCGRAQIVGTPYCKEHLERCYLPPANAQWRADQMANSFIRNYGRGVEQVDKEFDETPRNPVKSLEIVE